MRLVRNFLMNRPERVRGTSDPIVHSVGKAAS
jgi:hypothetical protein